MRGGGGAVVILAAGLVLFAGCAGSHPRNADGAFEGTVASVRSDRLTLDLVDGSVRIDTWSVCGDDTARHIAVGDEIVVFADRDLFSYEAWRILDEDGQPACSR